MNRLWFCLLFFLAVGNVAAQQVANGQFVAAGGMTITYTVTKNTSTPGNFYFTVTNSPAFGNFGSVWAGYLEYSNTQSTGSGTSRTWNIYAGTTTQARTGYVEGRLSNTSGNLTRVTFPIPAWNAVESPQTVTISPSTATIRVGQAVSLAASGGQNGYVWTSVTSGGGLVSDGANAAFTSNAPATYLVQVRSPAGNGYSESNYATATITVTAAEQVKVNLPKNDSGRPIEYIVEAAGQIIATETQNTDSMARTVTVTLPPNVPSGSVVTVYSKTVGIQQDPGTGTWSVVPGAVVTGPPVVITPTPSDNPTPPPPTDVKPPDAPKAPAPTSGDQTTKPLWSTPSGTGGLTDAGYKEGVDKTTSALEKINKTLEDRMGSGAGGSTGGGGGDGVESDEGTHTRLDSANSILQQYLDLGTAAKDQATVDRENTESVKADLGDGTNKNAAAKQAGTQAGEQGKAAAASALAETFGPAPSGSVPFVAPAADDVIVLDPVRNISIRTNPFSAGGPFGGVMSNLASFVRGLIAWGIVVTFYIWVLTEVSKTAEAFFKVAPFSKSIEDSINSVKIGGFGGGLGYLGRCAALLLLVPFVLTAPLIIMAAATSGLPMLSIVTSMATGAPQVGGGMMGEAAALADRVVPWGMLMASPAWYVIVQYGLIPSRFFWMMFGKFIPL